ncbi:DNA methyltransferase [Ralstonia solanacearum]|uniref:Methyltransferase n=1 Tax=Ralstonia solanacearum IPO1609 TaxID=564066 RepID=A0A7U7JCK6_RALSL|nr:DNA methyltransferase [Ralstonia solanacearum]CEJ16376.1 putative dna methylase protein [Ralstonia solanacearum IPO1609]
MNYAAFDNLAPEKISHLVINNFINPAILKKVTETHANVFSGNFTNQDLALDKLPKSLKKLANQKTKMDGLKLLSKFPTETVPAVFFDPQYRGVMDKLDYGNEGARQKGRAALSQMSDETIRNFVVEIDRVLCPSGHLLLWVDKFHLVEGIDAWTEGTSLETVDLVTWDKGRIGMGYRTRRKSEYLIILQKLPKKAKGHWTSHDIPDVWLEKVGRHHPHAKPEQLQSAIINAIVKPGDFVVDPASGGFSVMRSAINAGRNFIGCDLKVD